MVLKYIVNVEGPNWIAIVHGWVYFVYLLFTANLAVKVRWPIRKTIGVLLAGTIPLVGIIVEHVQTKDIAEVASEPFQVEVLQHLFRQPLATVLLQEVRRALDFHPLVTVGIRSQKACPALGYGKIGS